MKESFFMDQDLLWDYADGLLDAPTAAAVADYLQQHPDWQQEYETIVADRKAMLSMPLEKPHAGFTDRVMAAWVTDQMALKAPIQPKKDWIIYGIAAAFSFFIVGGILMIIIALAQTTLPETPAIVTKYTDKINVNIDFNKILLLLSHPMWLYLLYFGLTFAFVHLLDRKLRKTELTLN